MEADGLKTFLGVEKGRIGDKPNAGQLKIRRRAFAQGGGRCRGPLRLTAGRIGVGDAGLNTFFTAGVEGGSRGARD